MSCRKLPAIFLLLVSSTAAAQVRVWQGTLTVPTYEEGPPDPNPPFDQYANDRFNYPYTLRHNLINHRVEHAWRALFLENEYLKCSVLPDLGGHLYTCIDKISGKPMFYENPSIKKADVAYRGAWAALGIEFNLPVSHNWATVSPVDFAYGQKEDGSASVQVGNIDRVYGMQWTVELVLRPGSTILEERVTLNNRSDVRHRFSWWNNAGVQVWDVRQVWLEVQLERSMSLAQLGHCAEAVSSANHLTDSVPDLTFTEDGLEPLLASSRMNYLLGIFYKTCNLPDKAQARFRRAADRSRVKDAVWPWKASPQLPGFQEDSGKQKLEDILRRTVSANEISSRTGWWLYNAGMLNQAIGHTEHADTEFRGALLFPDQWLTYHLTRLALSNKNP